jgi:hypothetical protein
MKTSLPEHPVGLNYSDSCSFTADNQIGGIKTRYGQPQPWQNNIATIGRSKPQRAPEARKRNYKKSDGRPPDTSRQLLGKPHRPKLKDDRMSEDLEAEQMTRPSYCWDCNSCWIDTSLELIFNTVNRDYFTSFEPRFAHIRQNEAMWPLCQAMDLRHTIQDDPLTAAPQSNATSVLKTQRDGFRKHLKSQRIVSQPYQFNSLFVSLFSVQNMNFFIRLKLPPGLAGYSSEPEAWLYQRCS